MPTEFIPALRYRTLTRLYDGVVRVTMHDERFKRALVEQAELRAGHTVLDLGCGTATLTVLAKHACPVARVVGVDPDRDVLDLARAHIARAGVDVELLRATAEDAPLADSSVDRILSSLMLHHLDAAARRRTLRRAHAMLRPGGEIHIADWGRARGRAARAAFVVVQLLDGFTTTTENVRDGLVPALEESGFDAVRETQTFATMLGTVSLYRGTKRAVDSAP